MQSIIIEKPYKFIPPWRGTWLPYITQRFRIVDWYLRKYEGIVSHELRGVEHLEASVRAGHGILITPNHSRYADPFVMGFISRRLGIYPFTMASWHLFHQGRLQQFALRALGAFSIYREGTDRLSLDTAIDVLTEANRPLVIFPEGAVFRTNDRLQELLDGVSLIARTAAKRRIKDNENAKVVIHPVAIKYVPMAPVGPMVEEVLHDVEKRLTWDEHTSGEKDLIWRTRRAMHGLLCLKEIEHFGMPQPGSWEDRQTNLVDRLLDELELQWLGKAGSGPIIPRIKAIRTRIVPELLKAETSDAQRKQLWQQLAKVYLSQQISSYPFDYLNAPTTESRLLETVERLHEDLTDRCKRVGPLKVILQISEAIEVPAERPKGDRVDVMIELKEKLQSMLNELSQESKQIEVATD
jgi:hypothetical protein